MDVVIGGRDCPTNSNKHTLQVKVIINQPSQRQSAVRASCVVFILKLFEWVLYLETARLQRVLARDLKNRVHFAPKFSSTLNRLIKSNSVKKSTAFYIPRDKRIVVLPFSALKNKMCLKSDAAKLITLMSKRASPFWRCM
jgi:hypothetical protein